MMANSGTNGAQSHVRSVRYISIVIICASFAIAMLSPFQEAAQLPSPGGAEDQCKLHYARFHLLRTIPQTAALYWLAAPFLTSIDYAKLGLLPVIAFVWTTPWDNELVRQKAWWYPHSCVLARVGYVPIEEYFFFVIQSLMTTLFTILVTRWTTPKTLPPYRAPRLGATLALLPALTVVAGLTSLALSGGMESRYYLSMIAWWAAVPLTLLWWGTRHAWLHTLSGGQDWWSWLACIAIPTLYLCRADLYALRRGTWHISEDKSLELYISNDLPIEEAIFFFATNLILVSACFAFDRVVWQCRKAATTSTKSVFAPISPSNFSLSRSSIPLVWQHFVALDTLALPCKQTSEPLHTHTTQQALDDSLAILAKASKSFYTASMLLPWDLRIDLGCLYAFARAMDDFVDVPSSQKTSPKLAQRRIGMLRELVSASFGDNGSNTANNTVTSINDVLALYEDLFQGGAGATPYHDQRAALSSSAYAASSLRGIVPEHLWLELLHGYATDSIGGGPSFQGFAEQVSYAQDVAGSIGEMCVRVVLARSGVLVDKKYRPPRDIDQASLAEAATVDKEVSASLPRVDYAPGIKESSRLAENAVYCILRDARRMGVCLQLVNIARDVADDSSELKRCYLVLGGESRRMDLHKALLDGRIDGVNGAKKPRQPIDTEVLYQEKMALIDLARSIYTVSFPAISLIPSIPAQSGLRAACAVYMAIGDAVCRDGASGVMRRSRVHPLKRLHTALCTVYGAS